MNIWLHSSQYSEEEKREATALQQSLHSRIVGGEDIEKVVKTARIHYKRDSKIPFLVFVNAASNDIHWPKLRELGVLEMFID